MPAPNSNAGGLIDLGDFLDLAPENPLDNLEKFV
jgi:hypothetical protein